MLCFLSFHSHKHLDRSLSADVALGFKSLQPCGNKTVCFLAVKMLLGEESFLCVTASDLHNLHVPTEVTQRLRTAGRSWPFRLSLHFLIRVPIYLNKSRGRKKELKEGKQGNHVFVFLKFELFCLFLTNPVHKYAYLMSSEWSGLFGINLLTLLEIVWVCAKRLCYTLKERRAPLKNKKFED